jgi:chromosome segregation ATPase
VADIAAQVGQLKAEADKATEARHRAEAELGAATSRVEEVQRELAEFGVTTLAEAREKGKKMETALEGEAGRVRALLGKAGGQA